MLHRARAALVVCVVAVVFAGCEAQIRTAQNVTATSASLVAAGKSACGMGGTFQFQYSTSKAALEAGNGTKMPRQTFGQTKDACAANPPMATFSRKVTGLVADTTYYYRLCGRDANAAEDRCTSITQFTTDGMKDPMPRIRAEGTRLMAGDREFRVFGFNNREDAAWNEYVHNPTIATYMRSNFSLSQAKAVGGNVVRLHLQLFDFVERDAQGTLSMNQARLTAYAGLLREAELRHLYVDVIGNNVWLPNASPAWYDEMSNRQRWEVQAFFFRELAKAGAGSPAIFCYELTNEPAIKEDPNHSWYNGSYGGFHFTQTIARGIPAAQHAQVAQEWMTLLRDAIYAGDPGRLVTVGSLPFNGGAFGPAVQAPILPLLSVHLYPQAEDADSEIAMARAYGSQGRPMFVGETSAYQSTGDTFERFLVGARPYTSGYISFLPVVGPDDAVATNMAEAVWIANSQRFIAMRPQLM